MITAIFSLFLSSTILFAQIDTPEVEAVPAPEVERPTSSEGVMRKTDGKVPGSANAEPEDLSLIKSGKKTCHRVNGKLKCHKNSKIKSRKR